MFPSFLTWITNSMLTLNEQLYGVKKVIDDFVIFLFKFAIIAYGGEELIQYSNEHVSDEDHHEHEIREKVAPGKWTVEIHQLIKIKLTEKSLNEGKACLKEWGIGLQLIEHDAGAECKCSK